MLGRFDKSYEGNINEYTRIYDYLGMGNGGDDDITAFSLYHHISSHFWRDLSRNEVERKS